LCIVACGGGSNRSPDAGAGMEARVSRALALNADGSRLWVVNSDSDSVSVIDTQARTLLREIPLTAQPPAQDPVTHRYDPFAVPRALALNEANGNLYVAGEFSNLIYVIDIVTTTVASTIPVDAEPTAVVTSPDGRAAYVVSHQAGTVTKIDTATNTVA